MPTEEQIRRWEDLYFRATKEDDYNYLTKRLPVDKDHAEWLKGRTERAESAAMKNPEGSVGSGNEPSNVATSQLSCSPPSEHSIQGRSGTTEPVAAEPGKKYHFISMHSTRNGQWYGLIATLDTGTDENWISQEVVERLRLDVTKGLVEKYAMFDGQPMYSGETVRTTWCSDGQGISHVTTFHVVPKTIRKAPFDVVLGRNLLHSKEISFFSEKTGPNPTLVLTKVEVEEKERKVIQEMERRVAVETGKNAQKYQPVKRDSSSSKSTGGSVGHNPEGSKGNGQKSKR